MKRNPDHILRRIAGEAVLVSLDPSFQGVIGLNALGAEIYERLEEFESEADLIQALCQEYDAPPAEIAADAHAFLDELRQDRVILD